MCEQEKQERFTCSTIPGCILELNAETTLDDLVNLEISPRGKIAAQVMMRKAGLPIPDGVIITPRAFDSNGVLTPEAKEFINCWISERTGLNFQVRGDIRTEPDINPTEEMLRNLPTKIGLRDNQVIPGLTSLMTGNIDENSYFATSSENRVCCLQAIPPEGVDRNIVSGQMLLDPIRGVIMIELKADLATAIARGNQPPDVRIEIPVTDLKTLTTEQILKRLPEFKTEAHPETLKGNFKYALARYGRKKLKNLGIEINRLYRLNLSDPASKILNPKQVVEIQNYCTEMQTDQILTLINSIHNGAKLKKDLNLLDFLSYVAVYYIIREVDDSLHTVRTRLMNHLKTINSNTEDPLYGYTPPDLDIYSGIIAQAKRLAESGVLIGQMPKFSVIATGDTWQTVYWDLIPSGQRNPIDSFKDYETKHQYNQAKLRKKGYQIRRILSKEGGYLICDREGRQSISWNGEVYESVEAIPTNLINGIFKKALKYALREGD